jgi:hypothetical protein
MAPLERLFALEMESHRNLRRDAPGTQDPTALHTGYALQAGYEPILKRLGRVTAQDIERLARRCTAAGDPRDVLAARDLLIGLFGLWPDDSQHSACPI